MSPQPRLSPLPRLSVIIVSWQRPAELRRCLVALGQQDHPEIELCIVADPDAAEQTRVAIHAAGWTAGITDNPGGNISVARNIGLGMAAGDVVAFVDDDAVPEPTWASRLATPFLNPGVVAATGYTRGRNGFSYQWTACEVDSTGADHPLPLMEKTQLAHGTPQRAIKPVGTNCAFRRDVLIAAGGFDPAYSFYLEDADVALRLAPLGLTAVVPGAQVHHGFAASPRRRADRVPLTLHEIGASSMVFLRRHAASADWPAALARLRDEQRRRLLRHMVDGRLAPGQVAPLLRSLEAGITDGATRALPPRQALVPDEQPEHRQFLRLPGTGPRPGKLIAGRSWQAASLGRAARAAVAAGAITTVLRLSPTTLRHHITFHPDGYWLQRGGLFGAAARDEPAFRYWRFAARAGKESARWAKLRPMAEG